MTDTPVVPVDLDAIRARADAAMEGPWITVPDGLATDAEHGHDLNGPNGVWLTVGDDGGGAFSSAADAEFCAHSRTDVPAMADEITRLRERLRQAGEAWNELWHENAALEYHLKKSELAGARLDVLEELRRKGKVLLLSLEHHSTGISLRDAADAELSRREKENG